MREYSREDIFMGGPGLDGYVFRSEIYCPDCMEEIFQESGPWNWDNFRDSEEVPQPIFFGESDCPVYCARCGEYLYGPKDDV